MITELYVPRPALPAFLAAARADFRQHGAQLIYGTIRLIERDDESFLAWAREPWVCTVMNLHVDHSADGIAKAAGDFRRLIDRAIEHGGSYFLTYHRWASRAQIESVPSAHGRVPALEAAARSGRGVPERLVPPLQAHVRRSIVGLELRRTARRDLARSTTNGAVRWPRVERGNMPAPHDRASSRYSRRPVNGLSCRHRTHQTGKSSIMSEPIWNKFLTERDKAVFGTSGYGARGGFGKRPALLIIDVNYAFCDERPMPILESIKRWRNSCGEDAWVAMPYLKSLIDKAHEKGIPVIYTTGVRREDNWDNGSWSWKNSRSDEDDKTVKPPSNLDGNEIVAEIAPAPQDIVVLKQKPSGFFGTNMASYLTLLGCDSVIVTGTTTSGCVRATVLDAFSLNYRIALAEEGCFDRSQASHAINLCDMNAKYADVVKTSEVLAFFDSLPSGMFDLPKGSAHRRRNPSWRRISERRPVVGHSAAASQPSRPALCRASTCCKC